MGVGVGVGVDVWVWMCGVWGSATTCVVPFSSSPLRGGVMVGLHVFVQLVFNMGHTGTTSVHEAGRGEWAMHAVIPFHANIVRMYISFESSVPDAMFRILPPDIQELGAWGSGRAVPRATLSWATLIFLNDGAGLPDRVWLCSHLPKSSFWHGHPPQVFLHSHGVCARHPEGGA